MMQKVSKMIARMATFILRVLMTRGQSGDLLEERLVQTSRILAYFGNETDHLQSREVRQLLTEI
jgi:hypothetical protein